MSKNKKENSSQNNEELKDKIEKLKKERDEYLEGWKRTKADFTNYKNKEEERLENFRKRNQEKMIKDLIDVLDSFDLSVLSSDNDKVEKEGVELIRNQFESILKKNGLEKIEASVDDDFNPEFHEAVARIKSDKEEGKIVEVLETGYKISNRILRPTKVKVSEGK